MNESADATVNTNSNPADRFIDWEDLYCGSACTVLRLKSGE